MQHHTLCTSLAGVCTTWYRWSEARTILQRRRLAIGASPARRARVVAVTRPFPITTIEWRGGRAVWAGGGHW